MTSGSDITIALLMMRLLLRRLLMVMMRRNRSKAQRSWTTGTTGFDQISVRFRFIGQLRNGLLLIVQIRLTMCVVVMMVMIVGITSFGWGWIVCRW